MAAQITEISDIAKSYFQSERERRESGLGFALGIAQLSETIRKSRFEEMQQKATMFESSLTKIKASNEDILQKSALNFVSLLEQNVGTKEGYVPLILEGDDSNLDNWSNAFDKQFKGKNLDSYRDEIKSAILQSKSGQLEVANNLAIRLSDLSRNNPSVYSSIKATGILGKVQLEVDGESKWLTDEGKVDQINYWASQISNGINNRSRIAKEEIEMASGDYVMDQQLASDLMPKDLYKAETGDVQRSLDALSTFNQQEIKSEFLSDRLNTGNTRLTSIDKEYLDIQAVVEGEMAGGADDDDVAGYIERLSELGEERQSLVDDIRKDNDKLVSINSGLAELGLQNLSQDILNRKPEPNARDFFSESNALEERVDEFTSQYLPNLIGDKRKKEAVAMLSSFEKKVKDDKYKATVEPITPFSRFK